MIVLQIIAALLLALGSGLIFLALLKVDAEARGAEKPRRGHK